MHSPFGPGPYPDSSDSDAETLRMGCATEKKAVQAPKKRRLRFKQPSPIVKKVLMFAHMLHMSASQISLMMKYQLPPVMFWIHYKYGSQWGPVCYDTVEFFAGCKAWTKGMAARGFETATFEMLDDPVHQNIMNSYGFLYACELAMLTIDYLGFGWLAVLCSTWIWMCRASTGRSKWNPLGHKGRTSAKTEHGNVMMARAAAIMRLYGARRIDSCLEQPDNSCGPTGEPRMSATINLLEMKKTKISMGNFRGPSKKDMQLWSQGEWVPGLYRKFDRAMMGTPPAMPLTVPNEGPAGGVNGAAGLKDSQAYTLEFGHACASLFDLWRHRTEAEAARFKEADEMRALADTTLDNDEAWQVTDPWDDGEMFKVAADLNLPNDRMPWSPC